MKNTYFDTKTNFKMSLLMYQLKCKSSSNLFHVKETGKLVKPFIYGPGEVIPAYSLEDVMTKDNAIKIWGTESIDFGKINEMPRVMKNWMFKSMWILRLFWEGQDWQTDIISQCMKGVVKK